MITLVTIQPLTNPAELAQKLVRATAVDNVCMTISLGLAGQSGGPKVIVLYGPGYITERLGGLEFDISARSFFQVNTQQAKVLVKTAKQLAEVSAEDVVLDAYCGTGTMALSFARDVKRVVGVEVVSDAIRDAKRNAERNHITNAVFHVGKVEDVLPRWVDGAGASEGAGAHFDVAVLDPPRKGCEHAVLHALAQVRPKRIVYVSCNPVTLARDLRTLFAESYRITAVQPVDMFPNTSHVECVVATQYVGK